MDRKAPQLLSEVKLLLDELRLSVQVYSNFSCVLEELDIRIYAISEDYKRLQNEARKNADSIRSLEKRYSEILYRLSGEK